MTGVGTIFIVLILIIVGLNFTANNALISLFVNYIFYKDKLGASFIRILGAVIALSSVLFIIGESRLGVYVNIFVLLFMTFLSIRGRSNAQKEKLTAREKLLQEYQDEIRKKHEHIAELKKKGVTKSTHEDANLTPDEIRKKMWDDGKMTSKELINGFKDK